MSNYNKVILMGRLGQDPELKTLSNGQDVCNFTLATSEKFKDKSGQAQEKTQWHKIVAWAKTAELCAQYLGKGSQALIEGKVEYRSYENASGTKIYITEINANSIQFIGAKKESTGDFMQGPEPSFDSKEELPF